MSLKIGVEMISLDGVLGSRRAICEMLKSSQALKHISSKLDSFKGTIEQQNHL